MGSHSRGPRRPGGRHFALAPLGPPMERFARALVAGGLALVAGVWLFRLQPAGPASRYGGAALAIFGALALAAGIWMEIEV